MDSNKTSVHSLEQEQSDANADVLKKCGHILFTKKHDLKFACIFCEEAFTHLEKFREHVLNYHIDNLDYTTDFDSSLDLKPETLVSCEYDEESYEADKDMKLVHEDPEIKNETSLDIKIEEDVISTMITQVDQNLEEAYGYIHSIFSGVGNDQNQNTVGNTTESTLKYSCEFCSDIFNLPENLRSHFETDHVIKFPHKCSYCDKRYVLCKQKDLHEQIAHLGMHKGIKFFECDICFYKYKDGKSARLHKRRHISGKQEICNICNKIFSQKKHLIKHFSTHNKPYACAICSDSFKTEKLLDYHVTRHINPIIYECNICNETFIEPYKFKLHKKMHKIEKKNLSTVLDSELSDNENIDVKMDKTTMSGKEYECETCHEKILGEANFNQHIANHPVCEICTKKFKSELGLKLHVEKKKCNRNSLQPLVCAICSKTFKSQLGLKKHNAKDNCSSNKSLQHNKSLQQNKSLQRNKSLQQNKSLQRNKSLQHNKTLQHNCSICNENFTDKILFQQHKADHNKEKPLTCDICPKKFVSYLGLSLHTEKHSLKKHPCPFCSKTFTDRLKLKAHKKKHSGQNKDLKSKKAKLK